MVIEEYLSIDDGDCDGSSRVSVEVYREGERPYLYRMVYDGGQCHYPNAPSQAAVADNEVRYCINTGKFEIIPVPEIEYEPTPEPFWTTN